MNKDMRGYSCPGFDPFAELSKFMKDRPMALGTDTFEFDDKIMLEADMPGVKKEDISIEFKDSVLIVKAKRELTRSQEGMSDKVRNFSRRAGDYEFTIRFGDMALDVDNLKAVYENGMLTITIPKIVEPEKEPKKFAVE